MASDHKKPETFQPKRAPREARRPFLEIQYHPGDIRRGARYIFLSRRELAGWLAGAGFYLTFLVFGLVISPNVVGSILAQREYERLQEERTTQGEALRENLERLAVLEGESAETLLKMSKIYLAYGLSGESKGQGGYPAPPAGLDPAGLEDVPRAEGAASDGTPRSIFAAEIRRGFDLRGGINEHLEALRVFLTEVESFEDANADQVQTTPSLSPLRSDTFVMTSPYGTRRSPFTKEMDFHAGIDLAATIGTPIYAPADGTVNFAGRVELKRSVAWWRYGNLVALRNGERFMTLFGHCEDILVKVGEKVRQGQPIATVGNTGWSTNPHLHYEVRRLQEAGDWEPVNPRIYILDHRWRGEEQMLIRARKAPSTQDYEPLPRVIGR